MTKAEWREVKRGIVLLIWGLPSAVKFLITYEWLGAAELVLLCVVIWFEVYLWPWRLLTSWRDHRLLEELRKGVVRR